MSLLLSGALAAGLIQAAAAPAQAASDPVTQQVSTDHPVKGERGSLAEPRAKDKTPAHPKTPRHTWPKAGHQRLDLDAAKGTGTKHLRQAGASPVSLAPAPPVKVAAGATAKAGSATTPAMGTVDTEILSQERTEKAGVKGLLFTIAPQDRTAEVAAQKSAVSVGVDYDSFAGTYGGSYASRLHLVSYPACVLTSPEKDACRTATPVASRNDTAAKSLTTSAVTLSPSAPTVLAAEADASGDKGDFKATSLSDAASWSTNLNSGDFNWSYDFETPAVPGDLQPNLRLSYSSSSIDGRTANTNNQGSWVGDGFELGTGSIERRYKPCADDGQKGTNGSTPGDLCWDYDNAFLTFNGKGGELVPTGTDTFKLRQDDGTRIKRLRSADRANGDNDDEYWELTDPSGTRFYFGYNRLPGYASGKAATNSVYTVPVYGNDAAEPCHKDDFASSYCQQAWRWNLDYVVDRHGNALTYYYTKETNSYGRNLKADDNTSYTRGGYLTRIDYGLKADAVYTAKPTAQVIFSDAERCLPQSGVTCEASTIKDKSFYWYDTPWDLNCDSGAKCDANRMAPSFWTRKRLTGITTQVLKSDGTYAKVDSWAFGHKWGMADTDYQLLLDSIQHTGQAASPAIALPKTTFAYTQLANRLDETGDGYAPFIKARLSTINGETGGQTDVAYSAPACDKTDLPTPETNTTRCYPQYLDQDPDATKTEIQWFNKYVTAQVTVSDRTGGAADMITQYEYLGPAAWHYNDSDGLTHKKYRTWDQWRGYGQVRTQTGGSSGMKSQADTYFLRGMDGDRKASSGGTKSVTVSLGSGEGGPLTDLSAYAGGAYKTVVYDKPGGKILTKSVSLPWHYETAKKVRDWGTITANFGGVAETTDWATLDDGAGAKWRTTKTKTSYDTVAGRPTQVDDLGDTATAADDQCTRTTYADNTSANILDLDARVETVAKACTATPDRTKDVISDIRTAYDGGAYGAAPTKGDATFAAKLKSYSGTKATYLEAGTTYDAYGRSLTSTDLTADVTVDGSATPVRTPRTDGRTTTTVYVPATGNPTQIKVTTPPAKAGTSSTSLTTSTTLDPLRGVPVTTTDANGKNTVTAYDALGRKTKTWLADRATTDLPSYEYTYQITDGQPTAIGTRTIGNNDKQTKYSYTIYDGLMRERQTQSPGPEGGTIVADNFYDDRGLVEKTFAPYFTTGGPSTSLFLPDDALSVESQTRTDYDGLGRATEVRQIAGNGDGGAVLNTTKTIYSGDRTTVIPPAGGTATTTLTDVRGRATELRQLHKRDINAEADVTKYAYDNRGLLTSVTDPAGTAWTYTYDQMGRQTTAVDPDKGTTKTYYDDHGLVDHTTDARGVSLYNVYDGMGRKTQLLEGGATGTVRAEWTYDSAIGGKGLLASATRYENKQPYKSQVTYYDSLGRAVKQAVTIPSAEGKLAGTYNTSTTYARSGLVSGTSVSAAGGLPGGSVAYSYDDDTLWPTRVSADGHLAGLTTYTHTGQPDVTTVAPDTSTKTTQIKNTYEWGTRRLNNQVVSRQDQPGIDRDAVYHYDESGNITSVADTSRTGTDNQCYTYDYLGRLTEAWAQGTTTCSGSAGSATLGGPAPYWQSFLYDDAGNRTTQVQHDITGVSANNTTTTYTYPKPTDPHPHSLTQTTTNTPTGSKLEEYHYDATGNTDKRPGQSLLWDAEGHLASVTEENGDKTSYLYDADGNRLIARTPTETTLYLGTTEVTLAKGADKAKATRYTGLGGGVTAVQADDGSYSYTIADHQGTGQLAVDADSLSIQQRHSTPFGQPRGTNPSDWPGTKGFVGGTDETGTTGLQHLGAREYDPQIGRFISVDPIMDLTDPQQINGYTYGNNNPVTLSDPEGTRPDGVCGGNSSWCYDGNNKSGALVHHNESWRKTAIGWYWEEKDDKGYRIANGGIGYTGNYYDLTVHATKSEVVEALVYGLVPELAPVWDGAQAVRAASRGDWSEAGSRALGVIPGSDELRLMKLAAREAKAKRAAREAQEAARAEKKGVTPDACKNSFSPDTLVLLENGETKKIVDLVPGDKVEAGDPNSGKHKGARKVTATLINHDDDLVDVTTKTSSGKKQTLHTTAHHPFWDDTHHAWLRADELTAGDHLNTSDDKHVKVYAVTVVPGAATMYNLTVDELHTYYVLAGTTPVLVHNCNEVFHRAMSEKEFNQLGPNGEITVRGTENFVTQDREYLEGLRYQTHRKGGRNAEKYTVLVRYEMSPGTRDALIAVGKSPGEIGHDVNAVHLKSERGFDTYGLRPGSIGLFNSRIVGFGRVEDW
ncbi:polymorphic toxin-type HINT domain-containing protein [Streptomyces sp. NRRL F-5630]|uniref:polymorphic toxin-type HINT domain-containing protein n=1 Tax=Streptomyces sp. NRRL F-5630 TaxID=1463864 RepID=UPI003EBAD99A